MSKYTLLAIAPIALLAAMVGLCPTTPLLAEPLISIRATDDGLIDIDESAHMGAFATTNDVNLAIAAATNALAKVAHTGSWTNLVDRPIEVRANLDGDGKVRYRLFSNN